ncbi:MAG: TraB/GumN family protein [Vulcanimicrobiota bacterium]
MTSHDEILPDDVHLFELGERKIYVIGTAHVSAKSTELVETMLRELRPDSVAVELCGPRHHAMRHPEEWKKTDIVKVIREGKISLLVAQLILSSFQKKIGQKLGVQPGAEMLRAVEVANELGAETVLADREVSITLRRTWSNLGFWGGLKLLWSLLFEIFFNESTDLEEDEIERLKSADVLEEAMKEFAQALPQVRESLIDERDRYLASKIKNAPGNRVVAVVGAGHVAGIGNYLKEEIDIAPLEQIPPPSVWGKVLAWILPLLFLAAIIYGFVVGGSAVGGKMVWDFVWVTAVAGGLGALVSLSHPLTIVSAVIASPFGAAHPMIASGWIAGLAEATLRKPDVSDFEQLQEEPLGVRLFWKNRVTRVLLVIVSVNMAVTLGMAVSAYLISNHLAV